MANAGDRHDMCGVVDRVNHPITARTNAPGVRHPSELLAALRPWIFGKPMHSIHHAPEVATLEVPKLLDDLGLELDLVGHLESVPVFGAKFKTLFETRISPSRAYPKPRLGPFPRVASVVRAAF